jgi:hypothetical protein
MEKVKLPIKMDKYMKETFKMGKNMDTVFINGLMIQSMKDYIPMIKNMD